MSDRPGDKVIHPDIRAAEKPDSPDLHEARNAFADEFSMATRPRLGDGSMQRVNQANLDSQNQSIEIDFGGQVASRESGLTERQAKAREVNGKRNEMHLSQPVRAEDTLHLIDVSLQTTARLLEQPFLHLAEKDAVNKDVASFIEHFRHDPNQFNEDVAKAGGQVLGIIDKPMTPEERARMVGMLIPLFFLPGANKPLDPKLVKSMQLEQMTEAQLAEQGISRRVVEVYRGDKAPYSPINKYGHNKSYINEAGDLVPASVDGLYRGKPVDIVEHLNPTINREAKNCSPYTSFSESARHAVAEYGKSKITLNLEGLRHDIRSGVLSNVEIIDQTNMAQQIERSTYGELYKQRAFNDARAEREVLIKGTIPNKYFKVEVK